MTLDQSAEINLVVATPALKGMAFYQCCDLTFYGSAQSKSSTDSHDTSRYCAHHLKRTSLHLGCRILSARVTALDHSVVHFV